MDPSAYCTLGSFVVLCTEVRALCRLSILIFSFIYLMYMSVCLPACVYVYHACAWYLPRPEEGIRSHRTGVRSGFEPPCECWRQDLGSLQEHHWAISPALFFHFFLRQLFHVTQVGFNGPSWFTTAKTQKRKQRMVTSVVQGTPVRLNNTQLSWLKDMVRQLVTSST